jgi:hypothetical protein
MRTQALKTAIQISIKAVLHGQEVVFNRQVPQYERVTHFEVNYLEASQWELSRLREILHATIDEMRCIKFKYCSIATISGFTYLIGVKISSTIFPLIPSISVLSAALTYHANSLFDEVLCRK